MQGFSFVGINTVAVDLTGQATFEAGVFYCVQLCVMHRVHVEFVSIWDMRNQLVYMHVRMYARLNVCIYVYTRYRHVPGCTV